MLLAGTAAPSASRQWEYALYLEYPGTYEWQTPTQIAHATNAQAFLEKLGMPATIEANALRTKVFNHVGQEGWELAQIVKDSGREAYWFKRPK
jgi:hypothetical protein